MALNLDKDSKIEKQIVAQNSPTTQAAAPTETKPQSKPVDMNMGTQDTKKNPVVQTILDPDFQKLSAKEKLKVLKEQYPNIDPKTLSETLNQVETTILKDKTENSPSAKNLPEEESLLNQYAKNLEAETGKPQTIDDVIKSLKSIPENKLTDSDKKILNIIQKYQARKDQPLTTKEITNFLNENSEEISNLIPKEVVESAEWKQKTPQEKADIRVDAILNKMIPGYENFSNKEKAGMRQNFYEKIGQILVKDWNSLDHIDKKYKISNFVIMMEAMEESGKPLNELLNLKEADRKELAFNYITNHALDATSIDRVQSREWIHLSGTAQINEIIDNYLISQNPEFKNFPPEKQKQYKDEILNKFGKTFCGDKWEQMSSAAKDLKFQQIAVEFSVIKYSGHTLESYTSLPVSEQFKYQNEYAKDVLGHTPSDLELARQEYEIQIGHAPNKAELKDYLSKKQNPTEEERHILHRLKIEEELGQDLSSTQVPIENETVDFTIETKYNNDIMAYLENEFGLSKLGLTPQEYAKQHSEEIEEIIKHTEDPQLLQQFKTLFGLSNKKIKKIKNINQAIIAKMSEVDANLKNSKNSVEADKNIDEKDKMRKMAIDFECNDLAHKDIEIAAETIASLATRFGKELAIDLQKKDTKNSMALGKEYSVTAAKSINKNYDTKDGEAIAAAAVTSSEVPPAAQAVFAQAFIETAENDDIRTQHSEALSSLGNVNVLEGLAAASNSVGAKSRAKYNSHIDNAMQSLPPAQQATIRAARESGQISEQTLSQTTPVSSTSKTQATQNTKNTNNSGSQTQAQTPQVQPQTQTGIPNALNIQNTITTPKQTIVQSPVTSIDNKALINSTPSTKNSNKTSVKNKSAGNSSNETSTKLSAKETKELTRKADELLDKIETFRETQAESIKEWEKTHNEQKIKEAASGLAIDKSKDLVANLISESENTLPAGTKEEVKVFLETLYEKQGINAIYSILPEGKKIKFIEMIALSGSSDSINALANANKDNKQVILTLFQYSQDTNLIKYMRTEDILDLYLKGKITDVNLIKDNSEVLAKIMEIRLKNGTQPRELKGLFVMLKAEDQGVILNQYPEMAAEIPGSDQWKNQNNTQKTSLQNPQVQTLSQTEINKELTNKAVQNEEFKYNDFDFGYPEGAPMESSTVSNWKLNKRFKPFRA
ncbi:hypothetical protein HDR58_10490 [bacterium]|nr:hypothetical protein [bacterium]